MVASGGVQQQSNQKYLFHYHNYLHRILLHYRHEINLAVSFKSCFIFDLLSSFFLSCVFKNSLIVFTTIFKISDPAAQNYLQTFFQYLLIFLIKDCNKIKPVYKGHADYLWAYKCLISDKLLL